MHGMSGDFCPMTDRYNVVCCEMTAGHDSHMHYLSVGVPKRPVPTYHYEIIICGIYFRAMFNQVNMVNCKVFIRV